MSMGQGDGGVAATSLTRTAICGQAFLNGPSSAPAGAVTVSPGPSTLQDAIAAHAAGTTYYLTTGTYFINSSINPRDNDRIIGAPGAIIDGSISQQVAFGLNDHAGNVTIRYLTIQHFVGPQNNGIVNQGQGPGWTFEYNTVKDNPRTNGGAAALYLGDHNTLRYNCLTNNGQAGIGIDGATGDVVDHNEISFNGVGYEAIYNCGCSAGIKFFTSSMGIVTNNWIHDNGAVGLWIDTNNSFFLTQNNVIENNFAEGLFYEISYNTVVDSNLFARNNLGKNTQNSGFPNGAIYISESGGYDAGGLVLLNGVDVNGRLAITNNLLVNNANGVVLWQNPTRYCQGTSCSPTPLYPEMDPGGIDRWKTQNVLVESNTFVFDAVDSGCVASPGFYCGVNAIFSNDSAVDTAMAQSQNNHFEDNSYTGVWQFLISDQGSALSNVAAWQAAPWNQDPGSTFH
jgi:hypothetical protein